MRGVVIMTRIVLLLYLIFYKKSPKIAHILLKIKNPLWKRRFLSKKDLSLSVSRVLSCTVIYLDLSSPISSSDIHGVPSDGQPYWRKPNLAASGVYMAYRVTTISVSSYLAFPSLQGKPCGLFLLHYPWSRLHLTLSGTLSYAARTFLMVIWPRDRITNSNLL